MSIPVSSRIAGVLLILLVGDLRAQEGPFEEVPARIVAGIRDLGNRYGTPKSLRATGPRLLQGVDRWVARRPDDRALLLEAAELHASIAFAVHHEESPERAIERYDRAFEYACRAVDPSGEFGRLARRGGRGLRRDLEARETDEARALYWVSFAWGGRLDLQRDSLAAAIELPSAVSIMRRVREVDPSIEYGGPDLFLAHYEAILGPGLGGSVTRMNDHFESALAQSDGRNLLVHVQMAREYATSIQDRDLFVRLLREVRSTSPRILPDRVLVNRVARQRAARSLERVDDYFP